MPLPTGGQQPWPPREVAVAYEKFVPWAAWYSGDPDELAAFYMQVSQRVTNRPHARPSQYRGGLVGTLARWFWGQPIPQGEKRSKYHVPLPADIASTSASLLFSEPPNVMVPADAGAVGQTQDQIDRFCDEEFFTTMLEAAEVNAAFGGVYLRVVWDKDVSDRPWINAVHADAAVPEWKYGKLSAVTFWRVIHQDASNVVRHLERYEMINGQAVWQNGVYKGDPVNLGNPQPLSDYPETADFVDLLDGDDGQTIQLGIDQLPVVYVPNLRPNRMWRTWPAAAHFGRSDYAGVEALFDGIDEVFSSWMRDIRLAKGRLIVPDQYLRDRGPGRGAMWDGEQEVYEGFSMLPGQPPQITPQQFSIRVAEHSQSMQEIMTMAVGLSGYSGQTFGLTGDVAMTATEVAARERKSLITRKKKIGYFKPPLADLFQVLLKVGQTVFGWNCTPLRPDIEFGDVVQEDPNSLGQTLLAMRQAEAMSTLTMVEMLHPDWSEDEQKNEVKRIMHEKGLVPVVNPDTLGTPGGMPAAAGPAAPSTEVDTGNDDIPLWVPRHVEQSPRPDEFVEGLTPAEPPVISPAAYVGQ